MGRNHLADVLPIEPIERVQLITERGCPAGPRLADGLDPSSALDRLPSLYELMVVTREVDEELVNLQRQGQLALYPPCRGQEAAQVGCAAAVRHSDWLFPQYRELGCFLYRGIDPAGIGLGWRGAWHGGLGLVERCVAPIAIAVGSNALHAVGAAMASTWLGEEGVTVAFIGDGATSTGDVHEALNLAAVRQAPCIFFVQNNQWAISTPVRSQSRAQWIADKGIGYGMPAVRVDGNDVLACLLVVERAAALARSGGGPSLIEAVTYRMGAHTTSDDPTRYREQAEVESWSARDPIARCRAYLVHLGRWEDAIEEKAHDRARCARAALRVAVFDAPDPSPLELFEHVFTRPTRELECQRAELAVELDDDLEPGHEE